MTFVARFRSWAGRELVLWLALAMAALAAMSFSVLLLQTALSDIRAVVLIVAVTIVVGVAWRWAPPRLRRVPALAVITLIALGAIGVFTSGLAYTFSGFFTVLFCFVGLTRPPGTGVKLLPVAVPCWLLDTQPVTSATFARLPVAVGCWMLVSELIARYRQQQDAVQLELERQLEHDALTGLSSRRGLEEALDALGDDGVVVFLDLDFFKDINDSLGHAAGDEVLVQFGRAVSMVIGGQDTAIRYGGEEILLLLGQSTVNDADAVLTRLRDLWRALRPGITFSAGVAPVRGIRPDDAMRLADEALYRAKAAGRDRWISVPASETGTRADAGLPRPRQPRTSEHCVTGGPGGRSDVRPAKGDCGAGCTQRMPPAGA